jgi:hypothetical protein
MPPVEEARAIFRRLGYEVSGDGPELLAERKWRTVCVTATTSDDDRLLADGGTAHNHDYRFQCFVTWATETGDLVDRLRRTAVSGEWAVIGVERDAAQNEYEVVHGPAGATA